MTFCILGSGSTSLSTHTYNVHMEIRDSLKHFNTEWFQFVQSTSDSVDTNAVCTQEAEKLVRGGGHKCSVHTGSIVREKPVRGVGGGKGVGGEGKGEARP